MGKSKKDKKEKGEGKRKTKTMREIIEEHQKEQKFEEDTKHHFDDYQKDRLQHDKKMNKDKKRRKMRGEGKNRGD